MSVAALPQMPTAWVETSTSGSRSRRPPARIASSALAPAGSSSATSNALPARGDQASVEASACKIEFEMRYAFSNVVLEAAISPVFDRIANTFVDSFVRRAEQVHGQR